MNEHDQDIVDLLHRDAERIRESEQFDAKLQQDTMRIIRQLDPEPQVVSWFSPRRVAVAVTGLAVCVVLLLVLQPRPGPPSPVPGVVTNEGPASALSYRAALSEGEDALMAMLDEDARVLLPRSADIFQSRY